ncbi:terminase small subunit [Leptotrichia shahii]|uniref:terminase small subunit n=1 Tax=Leptotrichia shahii TaxID=157691 RepID=UPI0028D1EDF7|nr:terminase small subunit [Leptotrichia shahii]
MKRGEVALKLNARQKTFCEFYVASGNATESAIKAGYSNNYANAQTYKLLEKVGIKEYIKELQEKAKTSRIMTAIERREFLTELIKNRNEKAADRLKALDILNKMDGEYMEKIQMTGEIKTNPFKELTLEELKRIANE